MQDHWIADRMRRIEASGIRKIFELAKDLKDPVNLSIGQPHFPVPEPIRRAAQQAIEAGKNGYVVTQGIPELRDRLIRETAARLPGSNRDVLVTTGTSGAVMLALCATVNPGDEVILFDPYFVAYPHLVTLAGGTSVLVDTYPDFRIDLDRVRSAITPKTKVIMYSSPSNPTGAVVPVETLRGLASLCAERRILLIADEIYRSFQYDSAFRSAAEFDDNVLVLDGFGKTYGITGWRLGFAHGPRPIIQEMAKLQQFTFVCAPSMVQHAGVAALDVDMRSVIEDYKAKRNRLARALAPYYELPPAEGAFYLFPKAPGGDADAFVREAIRRNLLIIPGGAFSTRNTNFRVSYAVSDQTLDRGIEILVDMAK